VQPASSRVGTHVDAVVVAAHDGEGSSVDDQVVADVRGAAQPGPGERLPAPAPHEDRAVRGVYVQRFRKSSSPSRGTRFTSPDRGSPYSVSGVDLAGRPAVTADRRHRKATAATDPGHVLGTMMFATATAGLASTTRRACRARPAKWGSVASSSRTTTTLAASIAGAAPRPPNATPVSATASAASLPPSPTSRTQTPLRLQCPHGVDLLHGH
jgi:hypothetical protein